MEYYTEFHGEIQNGKYIDQTLREYFNDYNYKGIIFDIGAFEPIRISNTYHFEKNGWTCYCFEANPQGIPLLKEHRKNVFNFAIAEEDKDMITFNVVTTSGWTAGFSAINVSDDYKNIFGDFPDDAVTKVSVPQRTLNSIINEYIPDLTHIDIMSIDIEGGEYNCLLGIDLNKYRPKVMVIENAMPEKKDIQNYLEKFNYRLDKQILYNQYYVSNDFIY